ncbi:Hobo element transposase HFL1 [Oopsacas minuta]|uniref:Hobo element transposase HFL1 n=1 Tax=Oopsacas minuta TaxID=111878 RepID=A0AAV7JR05_9METZ|nr:Hobo element transposase HFL1 [Oopsacas minuta]
MYRCSYFPEKHTAVNIEKVIDENLSELNLSLVDTPCTTDKGSNFICATLAKTHVDCACHRINTVIDIAWKQAMDSNPELKLLDQSAHTLVKFVNQACGIQSELPTTLKHGGETRPWRSLHSMFFSILLREVVEFLSGFSDLFDLLEYANKPTLQNLVPVYYTLYELWQIKEEDSEIQQVLKAEFLPVLTEKLWNSIEMLHLSATFLDPSLRSFTFVRSKVDREGFFRQIKESLLSLAKELDQSNLDMQPQKKVKYDPFSWFQINETTTSTTTNQITDIDLQFNEELQMYIQETVPKRENFNLLDWWKQNKLRFPLLSIIAMRLLVIQASSSESERHFSAFNARHIVTSQRNAMLPETIEAVSVVLEGYKNNLI